MWILSHVNWAALHQIAFWMFLVWGLFSGTMGTIPEPFFFK